MLGDKTNWFSTDFEIYSIVVLVLVIIISCNAPILSENTIELYIEWLDKVISADLQDENLELILFELIKNY